MGKTLNTIPNRVTPRIGIISKKITAIPGWIASDMVTEKNSISGVLIAPLIII